MEGIAMEYVDTSTELNGLNNVRGEFHSFLSDDSDQDAATTAAHTEKFISLLLECNRVESNKSTIMEDTDGCAKQYRSASSLYLMSAISMKYDVVIDCAIGAPGHGKDVVDGLNAVDKRYLKTAMFRIINPEENGSEKTMNSHSATATGSVSFAEECKTILQHHADHVSNVLTSKSNKRQSGRKYSKKTYHIQKKKDVPYRNIAMTWTKSKFPKLKIAKNKEKIRDSSSVLSHYHYRFDPRLGHGKCAMRRIPCLCDQCCEMLDKKWIPGVNAENQPCYSPVLNCKYHDILGDYNNWIIMPFITYSNTCEDDIEELHKSILINISDKMGTFVTEYTYGAVNTNDSRTDGFYIVKFLSRPYTLQQDETYDNEILKEGCLVSDAEYLTPAMKDSSWYINSKLDAVKVDMKKVIVPKLDVSIAKSSSDLDYTMSSMTQKEIDEKEPFKLSSEDYDAIMDEIHRRESVEFEVEEYSDIETVEM